jgi:hypothetical protein
MTEHTADDLASLERRLNTMVLVEPEALQSDATELIAMGEILLFLVSDWPGWLERRVETVRFLDADTVTRSVSVDFILPTVPTPLNRGPLPITFVPLGTLRKRELVNFSLWDEHNNPLPLLSQRQNGPLAASVLVAAARMWVGDPDDVDDKLPTSLLEDLWNIAAGPPDDAIERWRRLRVPQGQEKGELEWRAQLVASAEFMSLARDLARNFYVLTPIVLEERRRLLKFSYQEVGEFARFRIQPRTPWLRHRSRRRSPPAGSPGLGTLHVRALLAEEPDSGAPKNKPGAQEGLRGIRASIASVGRVAVTGPDGDFVIQLPLGTHSVDWTSPDDLFPSVLFDEVELREPGKTVERTVTFCRSPLLPERVDSTELKLAEKLKRAFAIAPKPVQIFIPSIGQCHSHHLQFETADGFHITAAQILHAPSTLIGEESKAVVIAPPLMPLQQRVSLSSKEISVDRVAAATFSVRPRPSLIVRSAFFASLIGCGALLLTALANQSLSASPESWVTVMLVVPGGLSAYISRERENLFATESLIGLRTLALTTGVLSLLAACVTIVSRRTSVMSGSASLGNQYSWTSAVLWSLLGANVVTGCVLWVAWRRSRRPPELSAT